MIATPTSSDWDNVTLYEGFTLSISQGSTRASLGGQEQDRTEEKILFVKFPRVNGWLNKDFTQAVMALIELAEVVLDCSRIFVCLEKDAGGVNSLVHSLMYVGFSLGSSSLPGANSNYLMLEYETE